MDTIFTRDRAPDYRGVMGDAWRHDLDRVGKRYPNGAPRELTVASWIVTAPYAHPAWHSYAIFGLSLRDHPQWKPAIIHLPGATHEILVAALDPQFPTTIDDSPHFLTPLNFTGQVIETSDESFARRVDEAVRDVADGKLNPDTDWIRHWMHRFGSSNVLDPVHAGETRIVTPEVTLVIPPHPGPQDLH